MIIITTSGKIYVYLGMMSPLERKPREANDVYGNAIGVFFLYKKSCIICSFIELLSIVVFDNQKFVNFVVKFFSFRQTNVFALLVVLVYFNKVLE